MKMLATPKALVTTLTLATLACAPAIYDAEARGRASDRRERRTDEISLDELRRVDVANARDAIRRLRPEYLRPARLSRSAVDPQFAPVVYQNGTYAGNLAILETISLAEVLGIRYLPPVVAQVEYGSLCRCGGGVILVRTGVARGR